MVLTPGPLAHVRADMSLDAAPAEPAKPAKRPKAGKPAEAAPPAAPAYTDEQARADIDVVLNARGRDYLDARARLERSPAVAAPLVAARLSATPAPTLTEQRRLLALLSAIARPEDLALFADALRRDVAAAAKNTSERDGELRAAEPWRDILRAQGAAAVPTLTALVAEKTFTEELRALLLGDLVAVTPAPAVPELIALVGVGAPALRQALRLAIARRALASPSERAALVQVVDAALAASEPARKAGLILLRAALGDAADAAFTQLAAAIAEDESAAFVARVAAVRVLVARRSDPAAQASLEKIAAAHLTPDRRAQQASEILGSAALSGLEPARAAALVDRLQLTAADAPRIAAIAWTHASLPAGAAWIDASQQHAWPEVRSAALVRVDGPCDRAVVQRLRDATDVAGARNEPDPAVAREAIAALGRCGTAEAQAVLEAIVADKTQGVDRRAEAARQLVDRHGQVGADVVAAALRAEAEPGAALRLVRALQRIDGNASPAVREALCGAGDRDEVAATARKVARDLFPDDEAPCGAPRQ